MTAENTNATPQVAPEQKAEAAMREGDPAPRTIEVRGMQFTLPAQQPGDILLAVRTLNRAQRAEDDGQALEAMLDMAEAYLGEDGLRRFLRNVPASEAPEAIGELITAANAEYGTDLGESQASQRS